jgi:hypothetical protein
MRALAFVIPSLFAVAPLAAQQACSAAVQQDATAVASLRTELRSTQLNEDAPEDDISPRAQQNLSAFKATLAKTVRDILACNSTTVTAPMLQDELAKLLTANPPQPPSGATIMNGDKHYSEWLASGYGRNLLISIGNLTPQLLTVTFTFHIPCGDDNVLQVFERNGNQWRERLLWQSPPYKAINGAFGDIFEYALLQSSAGSAWRLVVVHGKPWCTSRFSSFAIDVLDPASDPMHPVILWHTDRSYSLSDFAPRLSASGDIFEFRIHADEMAFDPDNAFERSVIYRYRVSATGVTRLEPVATTGRGFVEEWLSMPWQEARSQAADSGSELLQHIHERYEKRFPTNSNVYTSWTSGPVRACIARGRFQVAFNSQRNVIVTGKPGGDHDPMIPYYFQIQQVDNGYQMVSASQTPDTACSGPDLMSKPPVMKR